MSSIWRLVVLALICYSVFHLGYSMVRYNIRSGATSGDFNRAFHEARQ